MEKTPTGPDGQVVVDRRVLAGYDNYLAAQRTVDGLSDAGFPVENVAIVGSDLTLEETVTGRMTNGRAALTGAGSGVLFGAVVGMFLGLFTSTTMSFVVLVLWAALWGAVMGAAFGFINHVFTGGKRDFASRSAIVAGRYDVLVAASHLDHARAVLDSTPGPSDTVVVEVPPSAGLYDPAAARATSPAGSVPPQPTASDSAAASVASPARSDAPPQPSLTDVSTRPTVPSSPTPDLSAPDVTASPAPRTGTDLPAESAAPAVPVTGEHQTPAPQAAVNHPAPAGPETSDPRVPAQGTSPDRPATTSAHPERPTS
ncbi:general stress protein [Streptosporangium sp. DT93]|uniref:general stress protein n=1 Tax=Streptosporangium sp. DT93 TaxID=3393428 RepID=UPI003CF646AE